MTIWMQQGFCARLASVVADIAAREGVDSAAVVVARTVQVVAMDAAPIKSGGQGVVALVPTWKLA